jgi:transketolase
MNIAPLNPKIFSNDIEQLPIRKGFGDGLLVLGEKDHRIVALCADLTESTVMHLFRNKFPERFVEMGIGEQSMASVASGLAAMGKIPFLSSYAMFSPGRNWEQIRTTICYNHVNVKIIGSHAGISVVLDGVGESCACTESSMCRAT